MKDENLVCFMDVYKCVLDYFALDEDKYNISLPCIYNHYNKMTHVIKNYKFILNIDILENELDEMNISQRKALLKMLK